ncbi:uncharacterized protein [Malus domestica]|uniref:uncharacterized protein n=1 Tax=Malus domestica TaxID=3750 RepID=UPI0039768AC7
MRKASTAVLAGAWAHVTANAASCGGAWRCVRPPFDLLSICVGETYPDDVRGQARLGGFVSTAYIFSNCAYVFTRILANLRRWLTSVVRLISRTNVSKGDSGVTTRRHTSFK